jgi:hypothetical protein
MATSYVVVVVVVVGATDAVVAAAVESGTFGPEVTGTNLLLWLNIFRFFQRIPPIFGACVLKPDLS